MIQILQFTHTASQNNIRQNLKRYALKEWQQCSHDTKIRQKVLNSFKTIKMISKKQLERQIQILKQFLFLTTNQQQLSISQKQSVQLLIVFSFQIFQASFRQLFFTHQFFTLQTFLLTKIEGYTIQSIGFVQMFKKIIQIRESIFLTVSLVFIKQFQNIKFVKNQKRKCICFNFIILIQFQKIFRPKKSFTLFSMFVVQALYPFSKAVLEQQSELEKQEKNSHDQNQQNFDTIKKQTERKVETTKSITQNNQSFNKGTQNLVEKQLELDKGKRLRSKSQQKQLQKAAQQQQFNKQQNQQVQYLSFDKGEKILVIQSYQTGWWYGHTINNSDFKGFFPSNYVQVPVTKPKPPLPPSQPAPESDEQLQIYDPNQEGVDWVQKQLKNITQGPIDSSYYLGIKGYKTVRIDEKNQNVLKGNNVKFDVSTGLAKVPIKDQAPTAKAVRQMGYYFDYHQWNQQRNSNPTKKARPDIRKKKPKQLKLKGMD